MRGICVHLAVNTPPRNGNKATNAVMTRMATLAESITFVRPAADTGLKSNQLVTGVEGGILGNWSRAGGEVRSYNTFYQQLAQRVFLCDGWL